LPYAQALLDSLGLQEIVLSFFALQPWFAFIYRGLPKTKVMLLSSQKSDTQ
jgi:hypothetical protein